MNKKLYVALPLSLKTAGRAWMGATCLAAGLVLALSGPDASAAASATQVEAFDYDATTGKLVKHIIEPGDAKLCMVTVMGYDEQGNVRSQTQRPCNGSVSLFTGSSAETNGEAASLATTHYAYAASRISQVPYTYLTDGSWTKRITNPEGEVVTETYSGVTGALVKQQSADASSPSEFVYDGFGRKILEKRPDGAGTRWQYQYCSEPNAQCPTVFGVAAAQAIIETPLAGPLDLTQPLTTGTVNGAITRVYVDVARRVIRTERQGFDGTAIYEDTSYNQVGLVYRKTLPYAQGTTSPAETVLLYDDLERVTSETSPVSGATTHTYTQLEVSTKNVLGYTIVTKFNEVGLKTKVTDAKSKNLDLQYDALGNIVKSIDHLGNTTVNYYDGRSRLIGKKDPDLGSWYFAYNVFGELVKQIDAKNQVAGVTYDKMGRSTMEADASLAVYRFYGRYADGSACPNGAGKVCELTAQNGYKKKLSYDTVGRLVRSDVNMGGVPFVTDWTFDSNGRLANTTYPSRALTTQNFYNSYGYLSEVRDASAPTTVFWRANKMDAQLHVLEQEFGNKTKTTDSYYPSGLLWTRLVKTLQDATIDSHTYEYYSDGSLKVRRLNDLTSNYVYDELRRLKDEVRSKGSEFSETITWSYDEVGNITSRTDLGTFAYPAAGALRPHAISSITGTVNGRANPSYVYDSNGNLSSVTSAGQAIRTVVWNAFNKVDSVEAVSGTSKKKLVYMYGPDRQRVLEMVMLNGAAYPTSKRYFVSNDQGNGPFYEDAGSERVHYVNANGKTIAVYELKSGAWDAYYVHEDSAGSWTRVSKLGGNAGTQLLYEPFGKRRKLDFRTDTAGTLSYDDVDRGYTGHDHMDEVGLINMNGRIYDPAIGRFLSADPYVRTADDMQAYNRYSYVENNPINLVDPSGYEPESSTGNWFSNVSSSSVLPAFSFGNFAPSNFYLSDLGLGLSPSRSSSYSFTSPQGWSLSDGGFGSQGTGFWADLKRCASGGCSVLDHPGGYSPSFGEKAGSFIGRYGWDLPSAIPIAGGFWDWGRSALRGDGAGMMAAVGTIALDFGSGGAEGTAIRLERLAAKGARAGEFSIVNWAGYPAGVPKPQGPFRLLEGAEYDAARSAANAANSTIRREQGLVGKAVDVHEIQPVKFGGSATDPANKLVLPRDVHRQQVTPWWNQLMRDVSGQ